MNRKATKELKAKLMDEQIGKKYSDAPPKYIMGIDTAVASSGKTVVVKIATDTSMAKIIAAEEIYDQRRTPVFKSEPSMPGFNNFSNRRKINLGLRHVRLMEGFKD